MNTTQAIERSDVDIDLLITSPDPLRETSPLSLVAELPSEGAKASMAKVFATIAIAALLVFLVTAVLIWFSSGGHLAGSIGVGLFAAFWGGVGFGSMVAAVQYSDS